MPSEQGLTMRQRIEIREDNSQGRIFVSRNISENASTVKQQKVASELAAFVQREIPAGRKAFLVCASTAPDGSITWTRAVNADGTLNVDESDIAKGQLKAS